MNASLPNLGVQRLSLPLPFPFNDASKTVHGADGADAVDAGSELDCARIRRLRSLLSLFALYALALVSVILLSDGADIGCILTGIAGHVLYASGKTAAAWREAGWLENARARISERRYTQLTRSRSFPAACGT